jgi:hypothetical protein
MVNAVSIHVLTVWAALCLHVPTVSVQLPNTRDTRSTKKLVVAQLLKVFLVFHRTSGLNSVPGYLLTVTAEYTVSYILPSAVISHMLEAGIAQSV